MPPDSEIPSANPGDSYRFIAITSFIVAIISIVTYLGKGSSGSDLLFLSLAALAFGILLMVASSLVRLLSEILSTLRDRPGTSAETPSREN